MKHALLAALLTCTATLAMAAEPEKSSGEKAAGGHAVGIDFVRLADTGQFEPNHGAMNLFYQGYLTKTSAFTVGYAWSRRASIPEIGYKLYTRGYQSGPFFEIGATSVDVKGTAYNGDAAALVAFGFEHSPIERIVVSGKVKALAGIDHPRTGDKDLVFLPSLSLMFTF